MRCRTAAARVLSAIACSLAIVALGTVALIAAPGARAQSAPRQLPRLAGTQFASAAAHAHSDSSTLQVATPVLQLAPGYYPSTQTLTITDTTAGATIYYTTDGTAPYVGTRFNNSAQQYSGPITISTSEVVVAIAVESGDLNSSTAVGRYLIGSSKSSFIYTVAGTGLNGYAGDAGPAVSALLNGPWGVALDSAGNIYVADTGNNVIRKIDAKTGLISTIAGTGIRGTSGDGGPATSAQLDSPYAIALDKSGNLFVLGRNNVPMRKIDAANGIISTIQFSGMSLAFDPAGNLYVADGTYSVWKVDETTGAGTLVAGAAYASTGQNSYSGDGGPATQAHLSAPSGIAFDTKGNLYIADTGNNAIRMVNTSGIISTVAGGPNIYLAGDGGPATQAGLVMPSGVALDSVGNLYIADTFHSEVRVVNTSGIINTIAGPPLINGQSVPSSYQSAGGDGDPATSVCLFEPTGIVSDPSGNIYFADFGGARIRKITPSMAPPTAQPAAPVFSLSAGTYATPQSLTISDPTPGAAIYVNISSDVPTGISEGYHGPIALTGTATVTAIAIAPGTVASAPTSATFTITQPPSSIMTTVAGSGIVGFSGTGGPATAAEFAAPWGIVADKYGNLYIADRNNDVVWKVDATSSNISVYAGTGSKNGSGDGTPATAAAVIDPVGLAIDSKGNLYISQVNIPYFDVGNAVRKVDAQTGIINTIAGDGTRGYSGDGGPATSAELFFPQGLAFDSKDNLYIADLYNGRVREVDAQTGIITTVAGGSSSFDLGDGGPATSAYLLPNDVAVDKQGNLYITDVGNNRIRKVTAATGIITTIAGNGNFGINAPGVLATDAEVAVGLGIAVDPSSNIYFSGYPVVQKIDAATGILSAVAGNTYFGFNGDGLSATVAGLFYPTGLTFDPAGNLYIADIYEDRVRKVVLSEPAPTPTFDPPAGTYTGAQSVTISDTAPHATIYYTTDGSTPTTSSTQYSGSITVSKSETINAIAVASGYSQSPVGSAAYAIQTTPPSPGQRLPRLPTEQR